MVGVDRGMDQSHDTVVHDSHNWNKKSNYMQNESYIYKQQDYTFINRNSS